MVTCYKMTNCLTSTATILQTEFPVNQANANYFSWGNIYLIAHTTSTAYTASGAVMHDATATHTVAVFGGMVVLLSYFLIK